MRTPEPKLARAKGFEAQVAEGRAKFVHEILVASGNGSGALERLAAATMRSFGNGKSLPGVQEKGTDEAAPNRPSSST